MRFATRRRAMHVGITSTLLAAVALPAGVAAAGPSPVPGPTVPHTYLSALSPSQIGALSANPNQNVIVLLRNQHPEVTGKGSQLAQRTAALSGDQAPITSELTALHAPRVHAYSFVNAVAATISKAEADRLSANPAVQAVVADSLVKASGTTAGISTAAAAAAGGAAPTPAASQTACPSDPSVPLLEPEALQTMNVEFQPGSNKPAAHDLATGKGVKVAVFPDGLDPNIPDFLRGGKSAIFDYQDFSGDGINAVTGGGEAFGDASSLISQGTQVYDLSNHVNPAHPLPPGCTIRIKGVSPDASVAVMKVFGNANSAFNSEILQGIDYAVSHDHVDILSESFGGNPVPNPGNDPIAVADSDAVAAGISVVVSSGDAGTFNTIGTPATAPGVIGAGATTTYRLYAQTTSYGFQFGKGGWQSSNVSAISSSGTTDYGPHTIDVLAPGESGWSDCSPNIAVFTNCGDIYHGSAPQPIEAFGGTSESAPLTAGVAALVIQGYRDTHGGASPSPDLVKQIIKSSAQDLGVVANNEGAGLVDGLRAVQTARSIHDASGSPAAAGKGLLYSTNEISHTAAPGQFLFDPVMVSNEGTTTQTISPAVKALGSPSTIAQGTLTLNPALDPTFIYQTGAKLHDVHLVTFTVASGTDRLLSRIAWDTKTLPTSTVRESLFDPSGAMAAQSRPQGNGAGFGQVEVRHPAAGTWTLLVFETVAYQGPLVYTITGQSFHTAPFAVFPSLQVVAPGDSAAFYVLMQEPAAPGDSAESLTFASDATDQPPLAEIPIVLRTLVPVGRHGGKFNGVLTGGNARMPFYGQELQYQFDVPGGADAVNININAGAPGYQIIGILADPNGSPVDAQATTPDGVTNFQTMNLTWVNPVAGRWSLELAQSFGVTALRTSTPLSGTISLKGPPVKATGLPHGSVAAGSPVTAAVHVTNTGSFPEAYSVDPRLDAHQTLSLSSLNAASGVLPITDPSTVPQFVLPPFASTLQVAAQSTLPITMSTSPFFGTPEILAVSQGNAAVATLQAPDIPASLWSCAPSEQGPFPTTATVTSYACGAAAVIKGFDPAVDSSTGNIWSALEGLTANYTPLVLLPGQSGDIAVTFTPSGTKGQVTSGFLAVETFSGFTVSSDQVALLPYHYRIK